MKKLKFLVFLFISIKAQFSMAQNNNLLLLGTIEDRVLELQPKLNLTEVETIKLTNILTKSTANFANLNIFSKDLEGQRDMIINHRNQALKKVLGTNRFKLFQVLEDIKKESLSEEYIDIMQALNISSEMNKALLEYRLKYILPQISLLNQEFVSTLSIENIIKLRELKAEYYAFANVIKQKPNDSENLSFTKYIGEENKKSLNLFMAKYKVKMESRRDDLERLRTKWSNDQDAIVSKLIADVNLSDEQKSRFSKGQFKIKEDLFELHFLMVMPFNEEYYLKSLDLIFNQQGYFKQIIQ